MGAKSQPTGVGERFGALTVVCRGDDYLFRNHHFPRFICVCDCGNKSLVRESSLRNGAIHNCQECGRKRAGELNSKPERVNYEEMNGHVVCTIANGVSFLIDETDYPLVSKYCWQYNRPRNYIFMSKRPQKPLSRFLLDCPVGLEVDHINHNRLDNRRNNLRIATRAENQANVSLKSTNTSGYKGVSFCKQTKKWRASIGKGKLQITIGRYDTREDAAKAYDIKAIELQGEFACLNYPSFHARKG
jgi:ribosomal protein S14